MKNYLFICLCWCVFYTANPLPASAQTLRLAIVASDEECKTAADFLTAAFSEDENLALLERNEIDRIQREQALSKANVDYLKLGELLGADGLIFLETSRKGTNSFLRTQLVAVKPGAIVGDMLSRFPTSQITEWASMTAKHFRPVLPKLGILKKDAIPISVVNLRAAVQSKEQNELERELTLLLISRLSHEREIFVLERRRLGALADEKELKDLRESSFWNGSYLIEGTLDRNGFSQEHATLHLQMKSPEETTPLQIEATGPRSKPSIIVEELAQKILEAVQRAPVSVPWNAKSEAQNYFEEARWFLKWGLWKESQAASETAWALGKRDPEAAVVRMQSYVAAVPHQYSRFKTSGGTYLNEANAQRNLLENKARVPEGLVVQKRGLEISYVEFEKPPGNSELLQLRRAFEFYLNFNKTLSEDEPKTNSPWLDAGLQSIHAASLVLQQQYFFSNSRQPFAEELTDVRLLTRKVAEVISSSPSVSNSYFTGDRAATHDELAHTIQEGTNIFGLEAGFGCFWQETPEDCIRLYRELMSSPAFCYIHKDFWLRSIERPHVVAWQSADAVRTERVWQQFIGELERSTNFLLQAEAKALKVADAENDDQKIAAYQALVSSIFANKQAWISHPVDLLYSEWGIGSLLERSGTVTPAREKMQQQFYKEDRPKLGEMENEYWRQPRDEKSSVNGRTAFEEQKAWLKNNTPYEFHTFTKTFSSHSYTKEQAAELRPLIAAYSSNLTAAAAGKSIREQQSAKSAQFFLRSVERSVTRVLEPAPAISASPQIVRAPNPIQARPTPLSQSQAQASVSTNQLLVKHFAQFPVQRLSTDEVVRFSLSRPLLRDGKLLFDFWFTYESIRATATTYSNTSMDYDGSAFYNLTADNWEVMLQPKPPMKTALGPSSYRMEHLLNSELHEGALYSSFKNELRRYNLQTRRWEFFPSGGGKQVRLFEVNGRLFAANEESFLEILDGGKRQQIFASTRRRPAASTLDKLETLGNPVLFSGPNHSVRAAVQQKIYAWMGGDWKATPAVPHTDAPAIFEDGVVLRRAVYGQGAEVWRYSNGAAEAELCWREEEATSRPGTSPPAVYVLNAPPMTAGPEPRWKNDRHLSLGSLVAADDGSLYFLRFNGLNFRPNTLEDNKVELVCLLRDAPEPVVLTLQFATNRAELLPPSLSAGRDDSSWMLFLPDALALKFSQFPSPNDRKPPGFWIIPRKELESAIVAERNSR